MTRPVKIGNIHIDTIDMDENVTRVVENLNNLHDEALLRHSSNKEDGND